jgi:hypothetical protein
MMALHHILDDYKDIHLSQMVVVVVASYGLLEDVVVNMFVKDVVSYLSIDRKYKVKFSSSKKLVYYCVMQKSPDF